MSPVGPSCRAVLSGLWYRSPMAVAGVGALIVGEGLRLALASIADRRRRGVRTLPAVARLEGLVLELVTPAAREPALAPVRAPEA